MASIGAAGEFYEQVRDKVSRNEFLCRIAVLQEESGGLFDDGAAAFLVTDSLGGNKRAISRVGELSPGQECTLYVKVARAYTPREFKRKDGKRSQVSNLEVTDDTGTCSLILWGADAEPVKDGTIKQGTTLKIVNGQVKKGFYGMEINVGKWSLLEIEPEDAPPLLFSHETVYTPLSGISDETPSLNIRGRLVSRSETRTFVQKDGGMGFVCDLTLDDGTAKKAVTVWGEHVRAAQKLQEGCEITIENAGARMRGGELALSASDRSLLKKA
ncbi:MAG: hypothetical protein CVT48_03015 [Thermoplasmata archaeon HGW-Thermoplasmata-1]|nr:MAG: hypothetical protein CVT48_03015 [Thermoplasmata archaeon HGW-Thermoplasmata-1]